MARNKPHAKKRRLMKVTKQNRSLGNAEDKPQYYHTPKEAHVEKK